MMEWYLAVLKNYVGFSGRAHRKEYWMYTLINLIIVLVLNVLVGVVEQLMIVSTIYALATLLPSLAVASRRLHDTDRSAWWLLLAIIPLVGLVLIVFLCQKGTEGPNRFGAKV